MPWFQQRPLSIRRLGHVVDEDLYFRQPPFDGNHFAAQQFQGHFFLRTAEFESHRSIESRLALCIDQVKVETFQLLDGQGVVKGDPEAGAGAEHDSPGAAVAGLADG